MRSMNEKRPPRRASWNRSQSEGFGPIKQVGVAISIGFPIFVVGIIFTITLLVSLVGGTTTLWLIAGGLALGGLILALSGRVI
jgi:hypothetical protein